MHASIRGQHGAGTHRRRTRCNGTPALVSNAATLSLIVNSDATIANIPCGSHIDRAHTYYKDGRKDFRGGRPIITVAQPTQSIMGKHATRSYAKNSATRRSLAQPKMRAAFVMVGDVLGKQPLRCRSLRAITWSSSSQQQLPTHARRF
jgi:hypothetical protein